MQTGFQRLLFTLSDENELIETDWNHLWCNETELKSNLYKVFVEILSIGSRLVCMFASQMVQLQQNIWIAFHIFWSWFKFNCCWHFLMMRNSISYLFEPENIFGIERFLFLICRNKTAIEFWWNDLGKTNNEWSSFEFILTNINY